MKRLNDSLLILLSIVLELTIVVNAFSSKTFSSVTRTLERQQQQPRFSLSPSAFPPKSNGSPIILLKMSSEEEEESQSKDEKIAELEKQIEIAKLEQQLRALKEETVVTDSNDKKEVVVDEVKASLQQQEVVVEQSVVSQDDNFKPSVNTNTAAYENSESDISITDDDTSNFADSGEPMFEMLSESWKEEDPEQSGEEIGGLLGNVAKVVLGLGVLTAFSQIPVGQDDYTKYSAVRSNPKKIDLGDLNDLKQSTNGL